MGNLDGLEKEVLSHVLPEDLIMSDEEVLDTVFYLIENNLGDMREIPKEHQEVLVNNMRRVYATALHHLNYELANDFYWKN